MFDYSDLDTDSEMLIGAITRKETICYLVWNYYFMYKNMVIQLNFWRKLILWNLGTSTQETKGLITSQEHASPYWNIKIWTMALMLLVLTRLTCFQVWKLGTSVVRQFTRHFRPPIDFLVPLELLGLLQRCGSMTILTLKFYLFPMMFYLLPSWSVETLTSFGLLGT